MHRRLLTRPSTVGYLIAAVAIGACRNEANTQRAAERRAVDTSAAYDSALAERLGADKYGMHPYVMAFLKAGPNRDQDSATAAEIQRQHLANIRRLAADGKLVLAGPFLDEGPLEGIFVFDVATLEEARTLTESDPAVRAGRLTLELHPWYGSAAVKEVNALHERIAKENP